MNQTSRELRKSVEQADPLAGSHPEMFLSDEEAHRILDRILAEPLPRSSSGPRTFTRRLALVAAATFVAVVGSIGLQLVNDDPLRGALAIEEHGDYISVKVKDAAADPEAMTNDLRAAGIDAEVVVVPVTPSLVGRWYEAELDSRYVNEADFIQDQAFEHVEVLKLPADPGGFVRLKVGRVTEPGEAYQDGGYDEMRPGGALECLHLENMTPPQAHRVLTGLGLDVVWGDSSEPPPAGTIDWAWFRGPGLVDVRVHDDGYEGWDEEPGSGIPSVCS